MMYPPNFIALRQIWSSHWLQEVFSLNQCYPKRLKMTFACWRQRMTSRHATYTCSVKNAGVWHWKVTLWYTWCNRDVTFWRVTHLCDVIFRVVTWRPVLPCRHQDLQMGNFKLIKYDVICIQCQKKVCHNETTRDMFLLKHFIWNLCLSWPSPFKINYHFGGKEMT